MGLLAAFTDQGILAIDLATGDCIHSGAYKRIALISPTVSQRPVTK